MASSTMPYSVTELCANADDAAAAKSASGGGNKYFVH
jgi:hypothetical protein